MAEAVDGLGQPLQPSYLIMRRCAGEEPLLADIAVFGLHQSIAFLFLPTLNADITFWA